MSQSLTVLVTGATGQQGGSVARALLKKGHKVRALTRKPDSKGALALQKLGAELAVGDFDDRDSLARAMSGVDAVYIMGTPFEAGESTETRQGITAVDAAKAAGVKHIVYSSVGGADRNTGIPHFDSKFAVEQHLAKAGVPYTIVAPAFFQDNLLSPMFVGGMKAQGVVAMALSAKRPLQQISVEEIGAFGALVLEQREKFQGRRVDIASNELTGEQLAATFSRVSGKPLRYMEVPIEQVRARSEDLARMFEWFEKVGYSADIAALRRDHPEVGWRSFEDWAQAQDWKALLGA
ncbi:NmrA/HSCARG family protein [Hyalangium rubrum]|uniref:NmrA/HSCARG family protein n=1 Tax=Hyalangium rubrum TaxID=3103134 RepID=A0ABU5HH30_9BACT|nr:NmrA/HSCARG family protein [Hyalangium sp. s54d21]MDY7232757.1 NmrA/HSCARG family protein [Hyalangium sp. s54d21]